MNVTSLSLVYGTDVSEELLPPFSNFTVMTQAAGYSKTSVPSTKLQGVTLQNTLIFNSYKAESCLGRQHTLSY